MRLKVVRVQGVGISGLPLGSLETKSHLDVAPVESYRVYYNPSSPRRGESCESKVARGSS
jgi:hypothetical protein